MAESEKSFLGRWSQRKAAQAEGKVLEEPAPPAPKLDLDPVHPAATAPSLVPDSAASAAAEEPVPKPPALTLADARELTKNSDFKPFMAGDVSPEVRNAAMKKLFADPHFNVMDGLDLYIDDYSVFEPIPESMLRQMVSAKFLNLFDDEDDKQNAAPDQLIAAPDNAFVPEGEAPPGAPPPPEPGHSIPLATAAAVTPDDHDHSDLRLQPNHAATGPNAGRST